VRGGVAAIQHIRQQPWETWQALRGWPKIVILLQ
jgi:hypothetical protein